MLGFACTQCPRSQPSVLPSPSGGSGDFGQGFFPAKLREIRAFQ